MKTIFARLFVMVLPALALLSCSGGKTTYYYDRPEAVTDEFELGTNLKVDEYFAGFTQENLPKVSGDVGVDITFLKPVHPKDGKGNIAQITVRAASTTSGGLHKPLGLSVLLDINQGMEKDKKIEVAKAALIDLITELPNGTEFALVAFNKRPRLVIPATVVTHANRGALRKAVSGIVADGGSNLHAAMLEGYRQLAQFKSAKIRDLVVLSDGRSQIGVVSPGALAIETELKPLEGVRIMALGYGTSVDEAALKRVAEEGFGRYHGGNSTEAMMSALHEEYAALRRPVAKDASLAIVSGDGFKINSVYGVGELAAATSEVIIPVGTLVPGEARLFIVEFEGPAPEPRGMPLTAKVTYKLLSTGKEASVTGSEWLASHGSDKEAKEFDKAVARNVLIATNALAMIEVSRLVKQREFAAADNLLDAQAVNIDVVRTWDKSEALKREDEAMTRIQREVQDRGDLEYLRPKRKVAREDEPSERQVRDSLRRTLAYAETIPAGPWKVLLSLFGTLYQ